MMEFLQKSTLTFIFLLLTWTELSANKIYVPDAEGNIIGLSNLWSKSLSCTGSYWNYGADIITKLYSYTVCFSQDCILETSNFNIKSIKTVFADIAIEGRVCTGAAPEPAGCTEYLEVGANVGNIKATSFGKSTEPLLQFPSPSDTKEKFTAAQNKNTEYFRSKGTIQFDNSDDKAYVKYQFNSKTMCGSLQNFTVYYYKCPSVTDSLAEFQSENAPSKAVGVEKYLGKCVKDAINVDGSDLIMKCKWNGTVEFTGKCLCDIGFSKVLTKCQKCGIREFKTVPGNEQCLQCGQNSLSTHDRTSCKCKDGFFREKGKETDSTAECFELPAPPTLIQVSNITPTSADVSWTHNPPDPGNYTVLCENCPKDRPFHETTHTNSINLTDLGSYADYRLKVAFVNTVTRIVGQTVSTGFNLKTKAGVPGVVSNLQQKTLTDGSVELTWNEPFAKGNNKITYLVTYGGSTAETTENKFLIESDTQTRSYDVKVAAQVSVNGKTLRGVAVPFAEKIEVKGGVSLNLAVGAGIGAVLLVIVVAIIAFFLWRRKNPPYTQVVRMEDGTVKLPGRFYPGAKLYVDPTTYNDVDDAVQEFAFEIDQKSLTIGKLLGGGEFADVYKGTLFKNGKSKDVAIKTLKPNSTKHDRDDFLSEAAIIGQFTDPNVISLEGVVLKERPNVIVLEFMSNGSLDKYLQDHDMQFTNLQLLGMARGVASGMKYLNELGFIHRDLAARNILVDEFRVCKVSDFGMSREIKVDETYDTQGGKIPVRWTAPESIQFKKFTTASDVWSYGILLWEIMSYGERPYWDWGNYEVLERLNQGYRLPPPMHCPKVIHNLMLDCWNKDRTKRPKMIAIRDQLEKWIRSPDLLEATTSVVTKTDENLDYTVLQTINKWLDAIGMGKYTENFLEQGFATPRQILGLTLEDLEGLGIGPIGHRRKIFKAIQSTKLQVEQRHNSVATGGTGGRKKTFSLPKKTSTS